MINKSDSHFEVFWLCWSQTKLDSTQTYYYNEFQLTHLAANQFLENLSR